jgi:hypothetical protein
MMPACSQARMAWQHAGLRSSAPDFGRQPDLLITIPGIGPRVALVIISESGPETAEYFLTEAHLASWAGLCPVTTNRPANASMAGPHGSRLFPERGPAPYSMAARPSDRACTGSSERTEDPRLARAAPGVLEVRWLG